MKKISVKLFFYVLWKGICQAMRWLYDHIAYKHEGKFFRFVSGLWMISKTFILTVIAGAIIYAISEDVWENFEDKKKSHEWDTYISNYIFIHNNTDEDSYIKNDQTGKITLKRISWYAAPEGIKDSR